MDRAASAIHRWEGFNPLAACDYYVRAGVLDARQFWELFEDTLRIRALEIPELDWLLFDSALSVYRAVPLLDHFRAIATGLSLPFVGIEAFYRQLIDNGMMPAGTLNQTVFYRAPTQAKRLGELMIEAGLLRPYTVDRCLAIQATIRERVGVNAAIGQIFRSVGSVSVTDFFRILAIGVGLPFESLDASAPTIFATAMRGS